MGTLTTRQHYLLAITQAFNVTPIVAMLGPRQSGKTTLARQLIEGGPFTHQPQLNYFDLEDPTTLARLDQPKLALEALEGLVVLDEIQRVPELFPVLRVLVDRPKNRAKFLILGSASPELLQQSSESLAGRISHIHVLPFSSWELKPELEKPLWIRGGYPPALLAADDNAAFLWREGYVRTFVERDIGLLGLNLPPPAMYRFWRMLAHYHGQTFNASEIGKSLGVANTTAARYLDALVHTFMLRRLSPWHANLKKQLIKQPKIYFRDSGIFHHLLGLRDYGAVQMHPKLGASWEGFALEQVARFYEARLGRAYFWGIHRVGEIDLLVEYQGRLHAFEIKYTDRPQVRSIMHHALELLGVQDVTIICPTAQSFALSERIFVKSLQEVCKE